MADETRALWPRNGKEKLLGVTTHGMTKSPEFRVWGAMLTRTGNKNYPKYPSYGGRGIETCDRWREAFLNFYDDMGPRPTPKHTLERKNNNLGYFKENCSWEIMAVQARNKRNNRYVYYRGERVLIFDLAKRFGLSYQGILRRIKNGWSIEDAVETPRYGKPPAINDRAV